MPKPEGQERSSTAATPTQVGAEASPRAASKRPPIGLAAKVSAVVLAVIALACVVSTPWTFGAGEDGVPRLNSGTPAQGRVAPAWWSGGEAQALRRAQAAAATEEGQERVRLLAAETGVDVQALMSSAAAASDPELARLAPGFFLGSDVLGRSLLVRVLAGGAISLLIGVAAAVISVVIGTLYGGIAGYAGGRIDALLMRIVDILYGLPSVLIVVLIAVAVDGVIDQALAARVERATEQQRVFVERELAGFPEGERATATPALMDRARALHPVREVSPGQQRAINVFTLLLATGGVSWLTLARVVRGEVLSLKARPFVEAARAIGASPARILLRHVAPNLVGPVVVYATLTVPQAILQESFLSFLGIGVQPPLPSWGNLAADGLRALNPYQSNWWVLLFPCLFLSATLLALSILGDELRDVIDPKRRSAQRAARDGDGWVDPVPGGQGAKAGRRSGAFGFSAGRASCRWLWAMLGEPAGQSRGSLVYLFAVVNEGMTLARGASGLEPGDRLDVIRIGKDPGAGLAAVASRVPMERFVGPEADANLADLAWLSPRVERHHAVIQSLRPAAVVPVRFGVVFSSEEALSTRLLEHAEELRRALVHLEGRAECAIRVYVDGSVGRSSPRPSPAQTIGGPVNGLANGHGAPPAGGAGYLARKRQMQASGVAAGSLRDGAMRDASPVDAAARALITLGERLGTRCLEAKPLRASAFGGSTLAPEEGASIRTFSTAVLVEPAACDEVQQAVRTLSEELTPNGVRLECSGPWPPYSFCPSLAGGATAVTEGQP
ncbi:MAG: GvpL/GvpF family gas vesicle protein [Planctomycetota bacterium]|nr:GvpL/GvpF family gas vesicle protein [Planctomycetota bacterium]